jgi:hypothetical protein
MYHLSHIVFAAWSPKYGFSQLCPLAPMEPKGEILPRHDFESHVYARKLRVTHLAQHEQRATGMLKAFFESKRGSSAADMKEDIV